MKIKAKLLKSIISVALTLVLVMGAVPINGLVMVAKADGLSGSGTAADPYLISSAADWDTFAAAVSGGTSFEGQTVKLTADISGITTMAGTSDNKFKGTFIGGGHTLTVNYTATGDGCAPFRYIRGATISTLKVAGTISTGKKFAAGIAGYSDGDSTIRNCQSSVAITSTVNGEGAHGGFVGKQQMESTLSKLDIINCLFDGSITGDNTNKCGGFVGWTNLGEITCINCMMTGTMDIGQTNDSYIFIRETRAVPICKVTNCYYDGGKSYGFITAQGTSTTDTGETLREKLGSGWEVSGGKTVPILSSTNLAIAVVSGIHECYLKTGGEIKPEPVVTAADGTALSKGTDYTVAWSGDGKTDGTYTITITGTGSYTGSQQISYIVANETENLGSHAFQMGEDEEGVFYKVSSKEDLCAIAAYVNANSANTCAGKRFKQTTDIDMSNVGFSSIGGNSTNGTIFAGTYDGGGYTISNLTVSGTYYIALFGHTEKASITRVTLVGATITSQNGGYSGGIVGRAEGGDIIKDCVVRNCSISGADNVGGIVGYLNNLESSTIRGCTVTGGKVSGSTKFGSLIGQSFGATSARFKEHTVVGCVADGVKRSDTDNDYHTDLVGTIVDVFTSIICCYLVGNSNVHAIKAGTGVKLTFGDSE